MSFKNKVVLITDASSGIGATTAITFAKEGANVAFIGTKVDKLKRVAEECDKTGNKSLPITADLANDDDVRRAVKETVDTFGKIDVLVNNAASVKYGGILDPEAISTYDSVFSVNLRGQVHITHLVAPYLMKTKGNVINISSVAGKMVSKSILHVSYGTSKAAFDHFTNRVALELAPHGVRVNSISPGPVRTDLFDNSEIDASLEDIKDVVALGRISDSQEVADLILYLAGDKAIGITGSDYVIDNGMLLQRA